MTPRRISLGVATPELRVVLACRDRPCVGTDAAVWSSDRGPMSESIPGWWSPGWLDAQIGLDLALRPSGDLLDRGIPCGRQVMVTTTAKEARYERSPFARRVQPVPSLDLRCPSR